MLSFKNYLKEELKKVGSQLGSNSGGVYHDTETNEKHYIKFYHNGDQAKAEALAGKIHNHMGIATLNPEHKIIDGKHAVSTKWNPNLEKMHPHEFHALHDDQKHDISKMYHAAVLTKNWDIVGLDHDNIERHKDTGKLHSVDAGGTFHFRAQGGHKDYGDDIAEKDSLMNRPHEPASQVFSHVLKDDKIRQHGLNAVKNMDMKHVHGLFKNSELPNHKELFDNFSKRREKLIGNG